MFCLNVEIVFFSNELFFQSFVAGYELFIKMSGHPNFLNILDISLSIWFRLLIQDNYNDIFF